MAEKVIPDDTMPSPLAVVGIGASAGGIKALQALFAALPATTGAAFVVIVHLDPDHSSELDKILALRTEMRVLQVTARERLAPNVVYVIPPNRRLLVAGDDIDAAEFDEPRGRRAPIDLFFRSFAEQHGDGFAVVLSGGGSDGSMGVRSVKERGGLILVQDPAEAEYPSMPQSAISSGADFVLPVHGLATRLTDLIGARMQLVKNALLEKDDQTVRRILEFVRSKSGHDFSRYKRATVMRRLLRRMQVTATSDLAGYLAFIQSHPEEVHGLFNDLLISVTRFFRDADAFDALAKLVMPKLLEERKGEDLLRIWVAGCATGEEVYSVVMLLMEEAARRERRPDIQVFATDLDADALAMARSGRYPLAIAADVSAERLQRFFMLEGDHYRIRREIRDLVVFASHNLLKDPPYSQIDLICCRNLLIYVDREAQQQVCHIFQYALQPNGFLFLGSSESADNPPGLFKAIDRDAHIYRANPRSRERVPAMPSELPIKRLPDLPTVASRREPVAAADGARHRQALEHLAPPSMFVDEGHLVVNLSESAGRFLLLSGGPITSRASDVVRPELRLELNAALHRVFEHHEKTVTLPIPVSFDNAVRAVVLHVAPVPSETGHGALVLFIEGGNVEKRVSDASRGRSVVARLQEELHATRDYLRTTREQYEAATEELRAANEELQSINEEYRSTAEELETSKEELQSINEELQTLS